MQWFKDGLRNLKNIDWLRKEHILIVAFGIFQRINGHRMSAISVNGWAYTLLTGELWLPPLILYLFIRYSSVNKEIFQNRNARRVFLLLFIVIELIAILVLVLDPRFPVVAEWLLAVGRGETSWWD